MTESLFLGIEQQNTQYYTKCPKGLCRIIPAEPLRLWLYLREFADTWLFHDENIAEDLGISAKTVAKYLTVLRKYNLITDIRYKHKGIFRGSKILVLEGFDYKLPEENTDYQKNIIERNLTDEQFEKIKTYLNTKTFHRNPSREVTVKNRNPSKPASGCLPTNKDLNKTNKDLTIRARQKNELPIELPDCVPPPLWEIIVQHRKEIRKPLTPLATTRLINELKKLHDQGNDLNEVVDNSINNRWTGFYEVKNQSISYSANGAITHEAGQRVHAPSKKTTDSNNYLERLKREAERTLAAMATVVT